jgi:hypothetical protein
MAPGMTGAGIGPRTTREPRRRTRASNIDVPGWRTRKIVTGSTYIQWKV